jgi:hypothetical protein
MHPLITAPMHPLTTAPMHPLTTAPMHPLTTAPMHPVATVQCSCEPRRQWICASQSALIDTRNVVAGSNYIPIGAVGSGFEVCGEDFGYVAFGEGCDGYEGVYADGAW